MLVLSSFVISLLAPALALYIPRAEVQGRTLGAHDDFDFPTDQDVLDSCPGGPGSSKLLHANWCTLVNVIDNPSTRTLTVLGEPQFNCGNGTNSVNVTVGGDSTVGQTVSVHVNTQTDNFNFKFDGDFNVPPGALIFGGVSSASTAETTISNSTMYTLPPGRQAVLVASVAQRSQTGTVQGTYSDPQYENFINATTSGVAVTQLTPIANDVQTNVYETACGTDPRDLSGITSA